ncbi:MAG: deoxyribodipyrimidine photo-lyase [Pseudomonadota bacterium]
MPNTDIAIVWFRRDLRLTDHPALHEAVTDHAQVIPLYLHCPPDVWAPGGASDWWLHHSLAALDDSLQQLGSRLTLQRGDPLAALLALADTTGAGTVYWHHLPEPAERRRDDAIAAGLTDAGITVRRANGSLLNVPGSVTTGSGTPYKVFTPYWRSVRRALDVPAPLPAPPTISTPAVPASLPLDQLELLPKIDWDSGLYATWTPGEAGASKRAAHFLAGPVDDYHVQRDLPATDGVSMLSPHLHFGEISVRTLWHQASARPANDGIETFQTELGWREFSHEILSAFPHTPDAPMNPKYAHFPWRSDDEAAPLISAWQRGQTGIPIVDAGMRQLWHTGWMHNRVRMIVASFLVKNIRAHWLHGARWFWDTLVDADLPANTMGWQWSAGSGADAAPYFRIFNPVRQGERFDASGAYVRHWVPEIAGVPDKYLHSPWTLPAKYQDHCGFVPGRDYPLPIVDLSGSRQAALDAFAKLKEATA